MKEKTCAHDNWGIDKADPSVGIFSDFIWCEDCGAIAVKHHEEQEDDYSETIIIVDEWTETE